jgi:hypothetical protein
MLYRVHLARSGIWTLNFSGDGIDCIVSYKSNYHTIMIMITTTVTTTVTSEYMFIGINVKVMSSYFQL